MTISTPPQQPADPAMDQALKDLHQSLAQALQLAVAHQQAGQLEEAETLYRSILQTQPNHPEANHSLGVLAVQMQQATAGLPYFAAALEARPEQQQYWLSYIDALIQADETQTAKQVLALGRQHGLQGDEVEALAERLNEGTPRAAPSNALAQSVKPARQAALHSGSKKTPGAKEVNALVALYGKGRLTEAEVLARSLTVRFPGYGFGWKALGVVLQQQGRNGDALLPTRKAVERLPTDAEAHGNLGATLQEQGRLTEAEASLRRALEIEPDYADAHYNLGITLHAQGRLSEAEASFRQALKIKPNFVEAHNNLGNVLQGLGRLSEAEASYRRALKIRPDFAEAHSSLLFTISQNEAVDVATLFAEHCRFGAQFEAPLRAQWPQHGNSREPARCLQVGFVSGDLYNHAVASFIEPVWAHLAAHAGLSLHAYANHPADDGVTQRLRGYVKHWHPVLGLSDAALAEKIRADGIDILIDLSGHTAHHRLLSFARKPAPVQVSWIGYPGTTGLKAMDYYLADRFRLPAGQFDWQFTEKIVQMPVSAPFTPYENAPSVNALPALSNGYMTFGSFNRLSKLNHTVIALWSQLLHALPDSRMMLGGMSQDEKYDTLIEWFAQEGIARERLSFYPRTGMDAYLSLHQQVDICLNPFPYTGATTLCHALWMGVPTLTLTGQTIPSRGSASILSHVGLEAFIAQDAAAFVQQGLSLAADFSSLANLRSGLRERFEQSAVGQPAIAAAGLERALRVMWQRWCAGLPAESFEVDLNKMDEVIQVFDK